MFSISLPWPPAILSPNGGQGTWKKRANAKAKLKTACYQLAKQSRPHFGQGHIPLLIIFHPPSNRGMDLDNMLYRSKSLIDGIAEGWGINDKMFRPITIDWGSTKPNGEVVVLI